MDTDDWGCVEPGELFSSVGKMRPLTELFENIDKETGYLLAGNCFPLTNGNNNVKVVTDIGDKHLPKQAPKILKKRAGLVDRPPCLKRVTFEVERFAAEHNATSKEIGDARAQLAVNLGAMPQKKPMINYKQLKLELKAAKENKAQERHLDVIAPIAKKTIRKGKSKKTRK
jgi:hypothetical protein